MVLKTINKNAFVWKVTLTRHYFLQEVFFSSFALYALLCVFTVPILLLNLHLPCYTINNYLFVLYNWSTFIILTRAEITSLPYNCITKAYNCTKYAHSRHSVNVCKMNFKNYMTEVQNNLHIQYCCLKCKK